MDARSRYIERFPKKTAQSVLKLHFQGAANVLSNPHTSCPVTAALAWEGALLSLVTSQKLRHGAEVGHLRGI